MAWIETDFGPGPLVLDSPHSGRDHPIDFRPAASLRALREAEDIDIDRLFAFALELGASRIAAHFPRTYIDVNRAPDEIDPQLLDAVWPDPVALSPKVRLGKGLIWRLLDDGTPIYGRLLSVDEVRARIAAFWEPYHRAVARAIAHSAERNGYCIHLNCHSMPSVAQALSTEHPGLVHADFVLGDRDHTTADPRLTQWMAQRLRDEGYTVSLNHPYKGVELVRRHGRPATHVHSVQLEINKRLYLDERTLQPLPQAQRLQQTLRHLMTALARLDPRRDL